MLPPLARDAAKAKRGANSLPFSSFRCVGTSIGQSAQLGDVPGARAHDSRDDYVDGGDDVSWR